MLFRSLGRASRKPLRVQVLALNANGRGSTPVDVNAHTTTHQRQPKSNNNKYQQSIATLAVSLAAVGTFAAAFSANAHSEAAAKDGDDIKDKYPLPDFLKTADDFLYPALQPFNTGKLQVSKTHSLYYEECGNPYGKVRSSLSRGAVVWYGALYEWGC